MTVAVDHLTQAKALSEVAVSAGVTVPMLLEVDIGMHRCGVPPLEPALRLAQELMDLRGVELRGLQAYEGHVVYLVDQEERRRESCESMQKACRTLELLGSHGIHLETISGSSSATYKFTGLLESVTEVQCGTYATMDWRYQQLVPEFEIALSILATVISASPASAVLDVGVKRVGAEFGVPRVKDVPELDIPRFAAEEHCVVPNTPGWKVGDLVQVQPSHACTTCNLYSEMFVHREDHVVDVWAIDGR